jgi:DNA polymerase-4
VVLKLKTADFRLRTRQKRLDRPTQNAELLFRAGAVLLAPEIGAQRYRLIGIGATALVPATELDRIGDLFAPPSASDPRLDQAIDRVRARFGDAAIGKGRGLAASLPKPRR